MCLTAAPREPAAAIQQRLNQLQVAVQHSQVQGVAPRKVEPLRVGPRLQQLHCHLQGQNTQGRWGRAADDEAPGLCKLQVSGLTEQAAAQCGD